MLDSSFHKLTYERTRDESCCTYNAPDQEKKVADGKTPDPVPVSPISFRK